MLLYHKFVSISSEIFGAAECEIIHSVNCEISHFVRCEMKFAPSHLRSKYFTAKLFHMAKSYFTRRRRISLKKAHICPDRQMCAFFWRRVRDSNPRFLSESLVFKTSSLNRSDNSPCAANHSTHCPKCQAYCLGVLPFGPTFFLVPSG